MKRLLILFVALVMIATLALPGLALAATTNFGPSSTGYFMFPISLSRQYTATTAGVFKTKFAWPCKLMGVYATARASGGTSPTLTVDVKEGAASVLSAPISITAGTVSEGTITDSSLADEATISVDLAITGTGPTWDDIDVVLALKCN